jgi:hypothetical protein
MFRRTAAVLAALFLAAGLSLGVAQAASAQTAPGTVTLNLECGPLVSDLTVNLTSGAPDTSYTISVLGLSTTVETNAVGSAVATVPILTPLLDTVTGLLPVIVADGGTPIIGTVAQVCGGL